MKLLIILSLILTLGACSQQKSKTSLKTSFSILGGIINGNSLLVNGGIMIFGKNQNTGEFFSKSYDESEVVLSNGRWDFAAVAWEGVGAAFTGNQRCATSFGVNLQGGSAEVNLNFSLLNCLSGVFGDATTKVASGEAKPLRIKNCSHYYGLYGDDNDCHKGIFKSYKVAFPAKGIGGGNSITSGCSSYTSGVAGNYENTTTPPTANLLSFPTTLKLPVINLPGGPAIPVEIKGYENFNCAGSEEVFTFNNRPLQAGLEFRAKFNSSDITYNDFTLVSNNCDATSALTATPLTFNHVVNGITQNEILICNKTQVTGIATHGNRNGTFNTAITNSIFLLGKDIDMTGETPSTITPFNADFEGYNYTLSNISMSTSTTDFGFFGIISGIANNKSEIKNLHFDYATLNVSIGSNINNFGIFAGAISNFADIRNININHSILNLLCGDTNCSNAGQFAGLVDGGTGSSNTDIDNISINDGAINISDSFANVGMLAGKIINRSFVRNIKVENSKISTASGEISGSNIGGLIGQIFGAAAANEAPEVWGALVDIEIGDILNNFKAPATNSNIGGLIGHVTGSASVVGARISNAKIIGAMDIDSSSSSEFIGGAIGLVGGPVVGTDYPGANILENIITNIDIDAVNSNHVGGILGSSNTDISYTAKFLRSLGDITCKQYCGGLIGSARQGTTIEKSYSRSNIIAFQGVGGLAGQADDQLPRATFNKCFSTGNIKATNTTSWAGGFIGYMANNGADFIDSYTTGTIDASNSGNTGLFVGKTTGPLSNTVSNSYTSSFFIGAATSFLRVSFGDNTGGNGLTSFFITNQDVSESLATDITSVGTAGQYTTLNFPTDWQITTTGPILTWSVPITTLGEAKLGIRNDPFILTSAEQWNVIKDNPGLMKAHFKLGANISFFGETFEPIGSIANPFTGGFRGNNFAIEDISLSENTSSEPLGIFRVIASDAYGNAGEVEDFDEETFTSKKLYLRNNGFYKNSPVSCTTCYVGMLAGLVQDSTSAYTNHSINIKNIEVVNGNVGGNSSDTQAMGTVIGKLSFQNPNTKIENIISNANIYQCSAANVGGIIGQIYQNAAITAPSYLELRHWKYAGDIDCLTESSNAVGGLIGYIPPAGAGTLRLRLEDMLVEDNVEIKGNDYIGGLFGQIIASSNFYFETGYSKADVTGNSKVGGIAGNIQAGNISGVYSNGTVAGASSTGAFAGYLDGGGTITNSYTSAISTVSDLSITKFIGPVTTWSCSSNCFFLDEALANSTAETIATSKKTADLVNNTSGTLSPGAPWFFDGVSFPKIIPEIFPEYFEDTI